MVLKRGMDQMSAWLLAVTATGAVFGAGYGISRVMARHAEQNEAEAAAAAEGQGEGRDKASEPREAEPSREPSESGKSPAQDGAKEPAAQEPGESEPHAASPKRPHPEGTEARPGTGGAAARSPRSRGGRDAAETPWSYGGSEGPDSWASLSEDYALCGQGKHQSPVDVETFALNRKLLPLRFDYKDTELTLRNNGRSISAEVARGNDVSMDGESYALVRIDFHSPSEHKIQGRPYDFETQLVHENAEGRTLVVSVFYERAGHTEKNQALARLWDKLPKAGDPASDPIAINVATFLPPHRSYYKYLGSLTTPPCTEGVQWVLFREPETLSEKQEDLFMTALDHSNGNPVRPVQKLNGRQILMFAR